MQIVRCGGMVAGGEISDIFGVYENGDAFINEATLGGCVQLSNITLENPISVKDAVIRKICADNGYDGIIMTSNYLIALKDNVAHFKDINDLHTDVHIVDFDTDMDYDVSEFEDELDSYEV